LKRIIGKQDKNVQALDLKILIATSVRMHMKKQFINMRGSCRKYIYAITLALSILFLFKENGLADSQWQGQLSGWITGNPEVSTDVGLRYIPTGSFVYYLKQGFMLDVEASLNAYGSGSLFSENENNQTGKIKPYRFWLRISQDQYEIRIGLQKINFGSAMILRPLMWFDSIDPRDPLQLTDGVLGVLGRYYFLNNTNVWLWTLYGNDRRRGWDYYPPDKTKPEFGGRIQVPFLTGEMAATIHHRKIEKDNHSSAANPTANRFGLDGKWDAGIGLWFESALLHRVGNNEKQKYQKSFTLGADYTFIMGNGFTISYEYFSLSESAEIFKSGQEVSFSAISMNCPLSILDQMTAMVYYSPDSKDWYRFVNWQRRYDNWSFYLMGFWNPDQFKIYQTQSENRIFTGKGIQIMVVYNH